MERVNSIGNLWGADFSYLATNRTHLMTMGVIVVTGLILCRALKTMTNSQTKLHKEVQRIVERSTTDRKLILTSQLLAQLIQREMTVHAVYST